jgi:tetratricopeptide (TPR) repeat protein
MLGWVNINLGQLRALPIKDGYVRARELAQHALERAPDSADVHYMLGYIHRAYDWDWAAAQAEARQAIAFGPNVSIWSAIFRPACRDTRGLGRC